jgi:hypothetical protein
MTIVIWNFIENAITHSFFFKKPLQRKKMYLKINQNSQMCAKIAEKQTKLYFPVNIHEF